MIIYVGMLNTICKYDDNKNLIPIDAMIYKINDLYHNDNEIHYWVEHSKELLEIKTKLDEWNCKYTSIKLGKPIYDLFIDSKNINYNSMIISNTFL